MLDGLDIFQIIVVPTNDFCLATVMLTHKSVNGKLYFAPWKRQSPTGFGGHSGGQISRKNDLKTIQTFQLKYLYS